jgi:hypothetical protein
VPPAPRLRLRFRPSRIPRLAAAFPGRDDRAFLAAVGRARRRGFLTRADLLRVARWKTPRSAPLVARNRDADVRAITRRAFAASDERARVEGLLRLSGVGWPTASAILHFCHRDPYPVLDVRALWALSVARRARGGFALWREYVRACRALARRARCSMRRLDRALWQYAKENAPPPAKRPR